jgi:hypothetical protein
LRSRADALDQPKEPKTCGRIILSYRRNANSQPDYFNSLSL